MKKVYLILLLLASMIPQVLAQQAKNITLSYPYANSICNNMDSVNVNVSGITATDTFVVERSIDSVTFVPVDSLWSSVIRVAVPNDTVFYRICKVGDTSNILRLVKLPPFSVGALTFQGLDSVAFCYGSEMTSLSVTIIGARAPLLSTSLQKRSLSGTWQPCSNISSTIEGITLYRQSVSNICGSGNSDSLVVKIHPHIADSIVGDQTVCHSSIPEALSLMGTSTNYAYQWRDSLTSWQNRANDTLSTLSFNDPIAEDRFFQLVITDTVSQCQTHSNIVNINIVASIPTPEIIGFPSDTTVCYNTPVTLAIPASIAENVNYKWEKNEGTGWEPIDSAQYTTFSATLTSTVSFRIQLANSCDTVYSNSVTFHVLEQYISPTVDTNTPTICYGTSTAIRLATPPMGDTSDISYYWQKRSGNVFIYIPESDNIDSILTDTLYEDTWYRVWVTSVHGCISEPPKIIAVHILPEMQAGILSNYQSICYNSRPDTITLSFPFTGGSGSFTYQWESRSSSGLNWDTIPDEYYSSYRPTYLTQDCYYKLAGHDAVCGDVRYTDSVLIHVFDPLIAPHIYIPQQGDTSVCYATAPDLLYVDTLAHGGGEDFSYYWVSTPADSVDWNPVPGGTGTTLSVNQLVSDMVFRVVAHSNEGCGNDTSNEYRVNVYPQFMAGSISAYNTLLCYHTSTHLQFDSLPHGGHNGYSIVWQWAADGQAFDSIPESNTVTINTVSLDMPHLYRAIATSEFCRVSDTTNTIRINVRAPFVGAQLAGNSQTICYGEILNYSIELSETAHGGEDSIYTYQWLKSLFFDHGYTSIDNANDVSYTPDTITSTTYYKVVTYNLCGTDTSDNADYVVVNPLPQTPTIFGDTAYLCASQEPVRYWVAPDDNLTYRWSVFPGTIIAGSDSSAVFVLWDDTLSNAYLNLQVTDNGTGCNNTQVYFIDIDTTDHAPEATQIKVKKGGNILICAEDSSAANYEWGFIQNSTGLYTAIDNSNYQYIQLPENHTFNPTIYTYSVTVWYGESKCRTTSYYVEGTDSEPSTAPQMVSMTVSPNPSHGEISLSLNADIEGKYIVGIFDAVGQPIYMKEGFDYVEDTFLKIDKHLHPGIYIVSVSTNNSVFNQKIIVR